MKNGFYGLTAEQYHADTMTPQPSLSSSIARILLKQSPLHAMLQHPRLNPHKADQAEEEDDKINFGSISHSILLEGDSTKVVWCEWDNWRTNASKEMRLMTRAAGKTPVLVKHKKKVEAMVTRAQEYLARSELKIRIQDGRVEQSVIWEERDNVWCRARLDWVSKSGDIILDYKSSTSAEPDHFIRQIARMGYEVQAEFYIRGLEAVAQCQPQFVFLCQETTSPYACSLVSLSESYRQLGRARVARAMKLWGECMQSQKWPAYSHRIAYAEPKPWELEEIQSDEGADL